MAVDRKDIPKVEVKEAECCPAGYVTDEAKKQCGSNYEHAVDPTREQDHPLTIPKTDSSK